MAHSGLLPLETSGGNKGNHEPSQSQNQNRDMKLRWSEEELGQQSTLNSGQGEHQVACLFALEH